MKIIRKYILKDFFSYFIFALLALSLVMVAGNLIKISDMVIRKGVNIFDALKIFSFFVPYLLGFTIPLAFMTAVLLAMGRLISDNEMVAINIAGVSLFKILNIFLILGIACSLFLFILNDKVIPSFHYRYRSLLKSVYSKNISTLIEPGVFLDNFSNYILYVSDKKNNHLKNIYIWEVDKKDNSTKVTFAKEGEFVIENNILKIKLEDGFRDQTNPKNENELYRLKFKVFFMDMPIKKTRKVKVDKKVSDMSIKEIRDKLRQLKTSKASPIELIAEIHKRISFSFSNPLD